MNGQRLDDALRVIIVEDESLYLDLLVNSLALYPHIHIVGTFADGATCLDGAVELRPQVALLDIELPGGMNGIEVGLCLRERLPDLGIVLLSNHRDAAFLSSLRRGKYTAWSYLQKKTVGNLDALRRAIEGTAAGFVILDQQLVVDARPKEASAVAQLTARQMEILQLIAQGFTNAAIAERLFISPKTTEHHINAIYRTLEIDGYSRYQPRVLAVLKYLEQSKFLHAPPKRATDGTR